MEVDPRTLLFCVRYWESTSYRDLCPCFFGRDSGSDQQAGSDDGRAANTSPAVDTDTSARREMLFDLSQEFNIGVMIGRNAAIRNRKIDKDYFCFFRRALFAP